MVNGEVQSIYSQQIKSIFKDRNILIRIDKKKHIEQMFNKGELSFGCAKIWSEINDSDGRADVDEGLIARFQKDLKKTKKRLLKK